MKAIRGNVWFIVMMLMWSILAGGAMAQEVVIEYWHPYGPPFDEAQTRAADIFNERYKGQIRVEVRAMPDLYERLPVAIASGVAPDAAHVTGIARVIEYADAGLVEPLDSLLSEIPEWDPGDIFPGFYETYRYKDQLYALPMYAQPTSLVWSKQAFDEAGLNSETGPVDHTELDEYIRSLTKKNPDNSLDSIGFLNGMWGGSLNFAYHWGANLFDKDTNKVNFLDESAVDALEWLAELYDFYGGTRAVNEFVAKFRSSGSSGLLTHLYSDPLFAGKQGMATYSHYHYYIAQTNAPDWEFGFAEIPALGRPTETQKAPIVHTDAEAVLAGTKNALAAAIFIHFKTMDPAALQATIQDSAHPAASISVNRTATQEGWIPDWYPMGLWMQNFDVLQRARPWPETPIVNDLVREFNAAYSRGIQGVANPTSSLEQGQSIVEGILNSVEN